jgi:hypothetical protein
MEQKLFRFSPAFVASLVSKIIANEVFADYMASRGISSSQSQRLVTDNYHLGTISAEHALQDVRDAQSMG